MNIPTRAICRHTQLSDSQKKIIMITAFYLCFHELQPFHTFLVFFLNFRKDRLDLQLFG